VAIVETGPLEEALERVQAFDWIVFASRHAVAAVTERMAMAPAGVRIAAVGQATARVLRQRGWPVDLLPSEANAAALVAAFAAEDAVRADKGSESHAFRSPIESAAGDFRQSDKGSESHAFRSPIESAAGDFRQSIKGARILYPASSRALPTIAAGLSQLGAEVVQVEAYRTESASSLDVEDCRSWITREGVGAVTFASPSAVEELERALGKDDFGRLLSTATAVAIGPTTARALAERGRAPALAESATLRGLALTTFRLLQTRH
jgi:uroporphyrinogen-III synthase